MTILTTNTTTNSMLKCAGDISRALKYDNFSSKVSWQGNSIDSQCFLSSLAGVLPRPVAGQLVGTNRGYTSLKSLPALRGCACWTREPLPSSACQFHTFFSAVPKKISGVREPGKEQGTLAPWVCHHTAERSSPAEGSWWLRTQNSNLTNPRVWYLLHLAIQPLVSNPNWLCLSPHRHFWLHLKALKQFWQAGHLRMHWIVFFTGEDGASIPLPAPIHTFHTLFPPESHCGQMLYSIWALFRLLNISWFLPHEGSTDLSFPQSAG